MRINEDEQWCRLSLMFDAGPAMTPDGLAHFTRQRMVRCGWPNRRHASQVGERAWEARALRMSL
jgi:hypothetical protein